MSHVFPVNNVFREDVVTNGDGSKETLSNAPAQKDGGFKVPKTIDPLQIHRLSARPLRPCGRV